MSDSLTSKLETSAQEVQNFFSHLVKHVTVFDLERGEIQFQVSGFNHLNNAKIRKVTRNVETDELLRKGPDAVPAREPHTIRQGRLVSIGDSKVDSGLAAIRHQTAEDVHPFDSDRRLLETLERRHQLLPAALLAEFLPGGPATV